MRNTHEYIVVHVLREATNVFFRRIKSYYFNAVRNTRWNRIKNLGLDHNVTSTLARE